jgi:hypothetical protein
MDVKQMNLDKDMAHIIMGALSISYSEGIYGVEGDGPTLDMARSAEKRVIREINAQFPEVVDHYSYMSNVKKVREKLRKESGQ